MLSYILTTAFLAVAVPAQDLSPVIPNYISTCKRHSPDFDMCIKNTLSSMIPKMSKYGLPELGVPRLDPLDVPELSFNYNKLKDIAGRMVIANSTAYGLAALSVLDVRSELLEHERFSLQLELAVPELRMAGDLLVSGRFGVFPVAGSGPYNLTTGEVRARWRLRGRPVELGGVEYLQLDQFLLTPAISQFRVDAENLLRGNPQLSKMVVNFTNRFWHILYEQSLPDFEDSLDKMGRELLNKIFIKVPFDQLFPLFHETPCTTTKPVKAPAQKPQQKPQQKPPQKPQQKPQQKPPGTTQKTTRKPATTSRRTLATALTTVRTTTKRRMFGFLVG